MIDREKMIEEIEKVLQLEQIKIANTTEEFAKLQKDGINRCNAEALYNANCRIVHDGEVVLTKEETEAPDKIPQKIKEFYDFIIEIEKEVARKEMAREIFSKLFDNMQVDSENGCKVYVFEAKEFNKLAKERGAEVEE